MAFAMMLRRMGVDATDHGFRSSFKDWASERTSFPHELSEMALAHAIKDKAEAAYRRGESSRKTPTANDRLGKISVRRK